MLDYSLAYTFAQKLGYSRFTNLQEKVFRDPCVYNDEQNLLVVGATSSGKTLVPLLIYVAAVLAAKRENRTYPKLLFVVPYRALAAQKYRELRRALYTLLDEEMYVVQSTGEIRQFDEKICQAEPDVSIVISEKAFLFSRSNSEFLSQYRYIVLDEVGLLADQSRGIKLDFLLSWVQTAQCKPRVIALATPFYDWTAYAKSFSFAVVNSNDRPRLLNCPVFFTGKGNIRWIDTAEWPDECSGLPSHALYREGKHAAAYCGELDRYCPLDTPCRRDQTLLCPELNHPCDRPAQMVPSGERFEFRAVAELCRWHLQQNHQILVFWNDREVCRQLALSLYEQLKDLLPVPPLQEECKSRVLQACTEIANEESDLKRTVPISEDEMFGILEPMHYEALCAGIGFHSSAVPLELRSYVEQHFLENKDLSIVCATETLAFGINSAVDAVIVANMNKNLEEGKQFLDANTYFNYIGRCGRLRPDRSMEEIVGWVHPILRCYGPSNPQFDPRDLNSEYSQWQTLQWQSRMPQPLNSTIFKKNNSYLPFLLLCLLGEEHKTKEELANWIARLPAPQDAEPQDLDRALDYLLEHGLVEDARTAGSARRQRLLPQEDACYRVVEDRRNLCGFTPSAEDFETILSALDQALQVPDELFAADLIFHLLEARVMENAMHNFRMLMFGNATVLETNTELEMEPSENSDESQLEENRRFEERFSAENLPHFLQMLPVGGKLLQLIEQETLNLHRVTIRRQLVIAAAILCWAESANPKQLYNWFHSSYPLIQSLTRELGYLLEITAECMYRVQARSEENMEALEKRKSELRKKVQALEKSVSFGIQPELYDQMLCYFREKAETNESAARLLKSISSMYPGTARQLRRIFSAYATLMEGIRCQIQGHGPKNFHAVQTALKELSTLSAVRSENTLWRDFAVRLRKEVSV